MYGTIKLVRRSLKLVKKQSCRLLGTSEIPK